MWSSAHVRACAWSHQYYRGDLTSAAHAVAETNNDMAGLIAGALAATEEPGSFLLASLQAELFRWCLGEGLRVVSR
jgi:hypothetical protein